MNYYSENEIDRVCGFFWPWEQIFRAYAVAALLLKLPQLCVLHFKYMFH